MLGKQPQRGLQQAGARVVAIAACGTGRARCALGSGLGNGRGRVHGGGL